MGSVKTGACVKTLCVANLLISLSKRAGHVYWKMLCIFVGVPRYASHLPGHSCPGVFFNEINRLSYAFLKRGTSGAPKNTLPGHRGTPFRGVPRTCPGTNLGLKFTPCRRREPAAR